MRQQIQNLSSNSFAAISSFTSPKTSTHQVDFLITTFKDKDLPKTNTRSYLALDQATEEKLKRSISSSAKKNRRTIGNFFRSPKAFGAPEATKPAMNQVALQTAAKPSNNINWKLFSINKQYFNAKYNEWLLRDKQKQAHRSPDPDSSDTLKYITAANAHLLKDPTIIQVALHSKAADRTDNTIGGFSFKQKKGFKLSMLGEAGKSKTDHSQNKLFSPKANLTMQNFVQDRKNYERDIIDQARFKRMHIMYRNQAKVPPLNLSKWEDQPKPPSIHRFEVIKKQKDNETTEKVKLQQKKIELQKKLANELFDGLKNMVTS